MTNINYEAIARENGFVVLKVIFLESYYWDDPVNEVLGESNYNTPEEAWKACCVENGLIEGEE